MTRFTFPRELIEQQSSAILKKVASQAKVGLGQAPKAQLVEFFTDYLSKRFPELIQNLTTNERRFLAEAAYGDGRVDRAAFQAKYGRLPPTVPASVDTHVKLIEVGKNDRTSGPAGGFILSSFDNEEADDDELEASGGEDGTGGKSVSEVTTVSGTEPPPLVGADLPGGGAVPTAAAAATTEEAEPDEHDVIARVPVHIGKTAYERVTFRGPTYLLSLFFERPDSRGPRVMPVVLREKLRELLPRPDGPVCPARSDLPSHQTMTLGWRKSKVNVDIRLFAGETQIFPEISRILAVIRSGKVKVSAATGRATPGGLKALAGALVLPEWDLEPPPKPAEDGKKKKRKAPVPARQIQGFRLPGGGLMTVQTLSSASSGNRSAGSIGTEEAGSLDDPAGTERLPGRAHAWSILVQQVGWARPKGSVLVLTKLGETVAAGPTPDHLRQAIDNLRSDDEWDELRQVKGLRGLNGKGRRWLLPLAERRQPVLETLADLPIGKWVALGDFERFMLASGRRMRVEADERGSLSLYFCSPQYGHLSGDRDLCRWILRVFLLGGLAPLGLIDIGFTNPHGIDPELGSLWGTDDHEFFTSADGLLYLRLTRLGAYCLGAADDYEAPVVERPRYLHVLPTFEIVPTKLAAAPLEDALFLDRFATRTGSTWTMSPASLLTFLEDGGKLDEIPRFLGERADQDLPDPTAARPFPGLATCGSCSQTRAGAPPWWAIPNPHCWCR